VGSRLAGRAGRAVRGGCEGGVRGVAPGPVSARAGPGFGRKLGYRRRNGPVSDQKVGPVEKIRGCCPRSARWRCGQTLRIAARMARRALRGWGGPRGGHHARQAARARPGTPVPRRARRRCRPGRTVEFRRFSVTASGRRVRRARRSMPRVCTATATGAVLQPHHGRTPMEGAVADLLHVGRAARRIRACTRTCSAHPRHHGPPGFCERAYPPPVRPAGRRSCLHVDRPGKAALSR